MKLSSTVGSATPSPSARTKTVDPAQRAAGGVDAIADHRLRHPVGQQQRQATIGQICLHHRQRPRQKRRATDRNRRPKRAPRPQLPAKQIPRLIQRIKRAPGASHLCGDGGGQPAHGREPCPADLLLSGQRARAAQPM